MLSALSVLWLSFPPTSLTKRSSAGQSSFLFFKISNEIYSTAYFFPTFLWMEVLFQDLLFGSLYLWLLSIIFSGLQYHQSVTGPTQCSVSTVVCGSQKGEEKKVCTFIQLYQHFHPKVAICPHSIAHFSDLSLKFH